jgi:hypothetical protein
MHNKFQEFEKQLKNKYSVDIDFTPSLEIQKIIDYHNFKEKDLYDLFKNNPMMIGFEKSFKRCSSHCIDVVEFHFLMNNHKQLKFIICNSSISSIVIIFPAEYENKYHLYLDKISKLKAFI